MLRELVIVVRAVLPEHRSRQSTLLDVIRFDCHRAGILIREGKQRFTVSRLNGQPWHFRLIVPVLGKPFLRIVQERFDDVVIFHVGVFGQIDTQ